MQLTFLPPRSNFSVFDDCYFPLLLLAKTKNRKIAQINQLFQLLNLIWANGCALHGLTRMLMSQNVNIDVSKDSPEVEATKTFGFFCLLQSNVTYSQLGNQLKVVSLWSNDTWQSKLLRSAWVMPTVIQLLCRKTHTTSSPSSSFCWNRKKPTLTNLYITFGKKG